MTQKFAIRSGALPMNAKVVGFRGSEGLSRPYAFDIYINVAGTDELALEEVIGSKATLQIDEGIFSVSSWSGIFSQFELVRAIKGNALYQARLVPQLWQLALTKHSRLFTKTTIPDVLKSVLEDEGILDYEFRLVGNYVEEEHVCQYRESSLDFIHRWAEREGIYYFFEQTDEGEKIVFVDDKSKHANVTTGSVRYHPTIGKDMSAGRHFEHFVARHQSLPLNVRLNDYDYLKPALALSGKETVSDAGFGEVVVYGNRIFTPEEGARVATVRAQELRARAATYHAAGPAHGLYAGYIFMIEEHPHVALNKEYLTTQAEHFGFVSDLAAAWGNTVPHVYDDVYRVDLTAISGDQQYRHASHTPWPRIDGFENGVVDGPATSEYAQIDDHGRYLVKFKFDEGTLKDGKASTYVRMMQPHGGAVEGFHFPLRKGTEVMFLFLGGDPDHPVIAGVVPNIQKPSPVVAANHTQNIIQTGGSNFITFEDLSGSQFINVYCPIQETNLYLGIDRPAGRIGLTSGKGPDAVEKGEYKQELGPFNFQLYTKGNGEVFTRGNLNVNAGKKLQLEGQGGVYLYADPEYNVHVLGTTEEHRTGKVHHRFDAEVDFDWKGDYTLDVEKNSTIHYKGTLTQTTDLAVDITNDNTLTQKTKGATVVSDKTSLTHFIGAEAGDGGATHFLKVNGTQEMEVTGTQKVTTGPQTWETKGQIEWKVDGDKKIEATSWHEESITCKSEIIGGWKNDMVFGVHTEVDCGNHTTFDLVTKVEIVAAFQLEGTWGPKKELMTVEQEVALAKQVSAGYWEVTALSAVKIMSPTVFVQTPMFMATSALTVVT